MRRSHLEAFRPVCPRCAGQGVPAALHLAHVLEETGQGGQGGDVIAGILHCPSADCRQEYPIIDGIPVIVPEVARILGERSAELLLRRDLPDALESLLGDALGQESWLDAARQMASTYGWDAYAALDPAEPPAGDGPQPGAASRCLDRLADLAGGPEYRLALDLGCAAGAISFRLAARQPEALVLGADLNLGLLRMAREAMQGQVSYPRRRIGLAYDRRRFAVELPGAPRVDFWACDASALPFRAAQSDLTVALNLLDCVPAPARLLAELARVTRPGGDILLATPYDWSIRATQPAQWVGGHSQRADHGGAGEGFLRALLTPGAHAQSVAGVAVRGEVQHWPWQTRLHDRSVVRYLTHLLAIARLED